MITGKQADMLEYWRWASAAWDLWLTQQGGPAAVEARARRRLAGLIHFARERSPFYRRHWAEAPETPSITCLPPVTRCVLMQHFETWVTDPTIARAQVEDFVADLSAVGAPFRGRYTVWTSSGTSGEPGMYLHDEEAMAVYDALQTTRFARQWLAVGPQAQNAARGGYAMVGATGGHFAGVASVERLRRMNPLLADRLRVISILRPLPELLAELREFAPTWIATYPTVLEALAEEQVAGRLAIHPASLWSGGETFTPAARALVERVFAVHTVNEYGASEFMSIAAGCPEGWLHVNADWVLLEPVDEQFRPTPPGQASHTVLLTNLANRVQPIIRYDLGDSVTVKPEPCGCGNLLPAIRVEGRRDDVLTVPARRGGHVRLLPLALTTVIEEAAHVHRFQVLQTAADALAVRLDVAPGECESAWLRVRDALHPWLETQGCVPLSLTLDLTPLPPRGKSGKLRQVVCATAFA